MKKAYFIGIAGKTMAPLAKAFKDMDWAVSGSDQKEVYPPITDFLSQNNIAYFKEYKEENLPNDPDLVVVGRSPLLINKDNPEYKKAVFLKLNVLSYPEVIGKYLIKENSIVVAGTYAKSTTTALISWILINAGLNPSYMFGGVPVNFSDGIKISDSNFSVVEGDETPALKESDPPKLMFYQPKFLLLTATEYDHPEIFKTRDSYVKAFINLVKLLPDNGVLFYDQRLVDKAVVNACKCPKIPFQTSNVKLPPSVLYKESAIRADILCTKLNIERKIIEDSIISFKGLRERNEFLGVFGGRYLFKDLSQQSSKIKSVLSLLRKQYPKNKIFVVFNPSATSLKFRENLDQYSDSFNLADQVIIGRVEFLKNVGRGERVTGSCLVKAFGGSKKVFYEPVDEKIIEFLKEKTGDGDLVVFMSSGGLRFTDLTKNIIKRLTDLS